MENKLKKLFEYQKFEKNPHLDSLISEALAKEYELSDESLLAVSAAGDPNIDKEKEKEEENK